MRISLLHFAAIGFVVSSTIGVSAQVPQQEARLHAPQPSQAQTSQTAAPRAAQHTPRGATDDPVADPKAIVVFGNARFTVLTPELIRMEWAADGKFEDHASFVFINRRLPVPKFSKQYEEMGASQHLTIKTDALTLTYNSAQHGRRTASRRTISPSSSPSTASQSPGIPGMTDTENLQGTTRTLDGARGDKTREPIEHGSRLALGLGAGRRFDAAALRLRDFRFPQGEKSPWPWVMERPAGERQDWYFFGYGHDYRKALGDYVRVAGRIPLPPRFAFGAWWSRYWAYSDQEIEELVRGFRENSTPLDVFVIDMDWHISREQLQAMGEGDKNNMDQSKHSLGWTGYTWKQALSRSRAVPRQASRESSEDQLESASRLGHSAMGEQLSGDGEGHGHRSGDKEIRALRLTNKKFADELLQPRASSAGETGHRFLVARLAAGAEHQDARRERRPGGSTTFTSPISSARASGRCCSIAGAGSAIIAIRSASRATRFPCGIRWPFSHGSRQPRPTWAMPTGATTSAATCPALSIRSSSRAGCSSARSVRFCARTPPRILTRSGASGPIPSRTPSILRSTFQLRYAHAALHLHRGAPHLRHWRCLSSAALLRLA